MNKCFVVAITAASPILSYLFELQMKFMISGDEALNSVVKSPNLRGLLLTNDFCHVGVE